MESSTHEKDILIRFADFLTAFLDKGPSQIPMFVNLSYKTAINKEKSEAGFFDKWAAALNYIL